MSRLNNLVVSYLIVDEYVGTMHKAILPFVLARFITRRTNVSEETAKKYIKELENGKFIEGKLYKIKYTEGGYRPWTTPKKLV